MQRTNRRSHAAAQAVGLVALGAAAGGGLGLIGADLAWCMTAGAGVVAYPAGRALLRAMRDAPPSLPADEASLADHRWPTVWRWFALALAVAAATGSIVLAAMVDKDWVIGAVGFAAAALGLLSWQFCRRGSTARHLLAWTAGLLVACEGNVVTNTDARDDVATLTKDVVKTIRDAAFAGAKEGAKEGVKEGLTEALDERDRRLAERLAAQGLASGAGLDQGRRAIIAAAVARARAAANAGDADAKAALDELDATGQAAKLAAWLDHQAAALPASAGDDAVVQANREAAALAEITGDSASALAFHDEVIRRRPEDAEALLLRGQLRLNSGGEISLAVADLKAAEHLAREPWIQTWSLILQGDAAKRRHSLADAKKLYDRAMALARSLAAKDPANTEWQRDLSVSHNKIGDVLRSQGDGPGALEAYRAGLGIAQSLAAKDPANTQWQRDLSVSHNKIGDVLVAQGDGPGALEAYRAGLGIAQSLAAKDPANTHWQRDLVVSHTKFAAIALAEGDRAEARRRYQEGLTIMRRLAAMDPSNAVWKSDVAWLEQQIAGLGE